MSSGRSGDGAARGAGGRERLASLSRPAPLRTTHLCGPDPPESPRRAAHPPGATHQILHYVPLGGVTSPLSRPIGRQRAWRGAWVRSQRRFIHEIGCWRKGGRKEAAATTAMGFSTAVIKAFLSVHLSSLLSSLLLLLLLLLLPRVIPTATRKKNLTCTHLLIATPHRYDRRTSDLITGKKRTFTET
ncbi:hypothetical protein E2C01_072539 [Portunus trituberculatus]|uniref:Uncharacterized protein n=1 Tax=Portunus trituberculatus TaxID=210409 RepID=A0A5B7I7F3_PORTR|nr:hypothetical protein [Portunus trituberculatus]